LLEQDKQLANAVDATGRTILHEAAYSGNVEIASLLTAAGANVNALNRQGGTVLHEALIHSSGNHAAIVSLLLAAGVNHNMLIQGGDMPLH